MTVWSVGSENMPRYTNIEKKNTYVTTSYNYIEGINKQIHKCISVYIYYIHIHIYKYTKL